MVQALVWKEWREHCWKMAALMAMTLVPVMTMRIWGRPLTMGGGRLDATVFLLGWAGAVWVAAFDVCGERSRGTARVLEALPGAGRWSFWIRTAMGMLTVLAPLAAVYWFMDGPGWGKVVRQAMPMAMLALYVYCLLRALTAGARREGLVAVTGVIVTLALVMTAGMVDAFLPYRYPPRAFLGVICPLMMETDREHIGAVLAAQGAVCLLLCGIGHAREVRQWWPTGGKNPMRGSAGAAGLGAKDAGWATSHPLVWKEWREQRGMILGVGIGAVLTAGVLAVQAAAFRWNQADRGAAFVRMFFSVLSAAGTFAPSLLAVALGIGVFTGDIEPGLGEFWRTRPLDATRVLFTKFGVAAGGLAAMLCLLAVGGIGLGWTRDWGTADWRHDPSRVMLGQMAWLPMVFMTAALAMVWLRWALGAAAIAAAVTMSVAYFPMRWQWDEYFVEVLMDGELDSRVGLQVLGLLLATAAMAVGVKWGFERTGRGRG